MAARVVLSFGFFLLRAFLAKGGRVHGIPEGGLGLVVGL